MRNLQQLNLRNNTISSIDPVAFETVPELTTLDLGQNRLAQINRDTFTGLKKLFWLDLCCNGIRTFQDGTFTDKIAVDVDLEFQIEEFLRSCCF